MKRGPRGLKPEEEKLWRKVADTTNPMQRPASASSIEPKPVKTPAPDDPRFTPPSFRVGETAVSRLPAQLKAPAAPLRMDRRTFTRMKRGKAVPEARIDLHGMTVAAAQTALTSFLLRASGDGKRLVLVITGKGRHDDDGDPVPRRKGVLRQHLPAWLSSPPLNGLVLEYSPAHQRHGGSGAFYVYLARRR